MFGVNVKRSNIIALILGIIGIICLALKVFKVFPDEELYTLIALVFLLFGFALYLRPKMKIMKNKSTYLMKYRENFYNELSKQNKKMTELKEVVFEEKADGIYYGSVSFAGLSFKEFEILTKEMLRDFVMIVYGEPCEKGYPNKAKVETFVVKVKKKDGSVLESKMVEDYKIL